MRGLLLLLLSAVSSRTSNRGWLSNLRALSQLPGSRTSTTVSAWDGVLEAAQLGEVRELASTLAADRHVFVLGAPSNALEAAINSLATQSHAAAANADQSAGSFFVGSLTTQAHAAAADADPNVEKLFVEYWARQSWMHLEAHRDCDEFLNGEAFKRAGGVAARPACAVLRYPNSGHVLYLDVGSDVQGPTCVFDDCAPADVPTSPERAMSHTHGHFDGRAPPGGAAGTGSGAEADKLAPVLLPLLPVFRRMHVVPAVSNRLLRFSGECMHGVPRPFDAYLANTASRGDGGGGGGAEAREEAATTRSFGQEGASLRRQVLLFNVWQGSPPLDVHPASTAAAPAPAAAVHGSAAPAPRAAGGRSAEGEEGSGEGGHLLRCAPHSGWRPVRQVGVPARARLWPPAVAVAVAVPLVVSMLGPPHRRGYQSRVFCARAPPAVRVALGESHCHSVVQLDWAANLLVRFALLSASRAAAAEPRRAVTQPVSAVEGAQLTEEVDDAAARAAGDSDTGIRRGYDGSERPVLRLHADDAVAPDWP